jgi:hypothetical protein
VSRRRVGEEGIRLTHGERSRGDEKRCALGIGSVRRLLATRRGPRAEADSVVIRSKPIENAVFAQLVGDQDREREGLSKYRLARPYRGECSID